MDVYCQDWNNQWPANPGILVASGYAFAHDFIDRGGEPDLRNRKFGCIDLEAYDPHRQEDVAALLVVANAADTSEQYYSK